MDPTSAGEVSRPQVDPEREAMWRAALSGADPGMKRMRGLFRLIPSSPRCKQCNSPFGGLGGPVMRMFGKQPWAKNPHFCGQCYQFLADNFGGAEIELSLLFADVRGSTALAERIGTRAFTDVLNRFYREAVRIVIDLDGLIDKFVGDEVVALFAPGWSGPDHARRAIEAADAILSATGHGRDEPWLPVGAAVHTGVAYVGAVGSAGTVVDFTALGDPVNATARLASAARAGSVLVTADAVAAARLDALDPQRAAPYDLRGRAEPMVAYELRTGEAATLLR